MRYLKTLAVLVMVGSATAQNSPVTNLSALDGYPTISEAIAGANVGDALQLAAISFKERLILSTPIVLKGAKAGGTILDILNTNGCGTGNESSSVHIRHLTGEALTIQSNSRTPIRLELNGGQLINAGADAIVVTAAGTADSLVVLGAVGILHRHALKFDVPCGHRIEGNSFHLSSMFISL